MLLTFQKNNSRSVRADSIYQKNQKGKPYENGFTLIEKPISSLKNLGSVMILYSVSWGYYPICVKNKMVADILV
jgi:hypothetical protein